MIEFFIRKREISKMKKVLENKLGVELEIFPTKVLIKGSTVDEFDAERVFEAIKFGFSIKKALLLKNEDFVFRVVHIKDHSKRRLKDVVSRVVGRYGKTKRVISDTSGCEIFVTGGEVGLIGDVEDVENAEVGLINLIKGSKQSNVYRYLERMNTSKKEDFFDDIK